MICVGQLYAIRPKIGICVIDDLRYQNEYDALVEEWMDLYQTNVVISIQKVDAQAFFIKIISQRNA